MCVCVSVSVCVSVCVNLADGVDLKGVHTDARVVHLQLAVASVYHKHYTVHCRSRERVERTQPVLK